MNIEQLLRDGWQRIQSMPDDPKDSISLGKSTSSAMCFAQIFPIESQKSMPFDNNQEIVNGIHHSLSDNQALIEVSGGNGNGTQFVYSIIKTLRETESVQYFLRANVATQEGIIEARAFFDCLGAASIRDNTVFEVAIRQGIISMHNTSKWMRDPYDKNLQRPFMMNLSEDEQYDKMFPEQPLSQARRFIRLLSAINDSAPKKIDTVKPSDDPMSNCHQMVNDFINEHLNSDINRLASFDLRKLEGMKRYGDTHGRAFNPYNTDLVKAIAALAFQDIAKPEVLFDKKRGTLNLLPAPLIKEDLWGNQVGNQFVMMSFFPHKDKASVSRRVVPCATLCNTIGNLYLHPVSFDEYRHSHAHGRFLIDHTFADLHKALTSDAPSKQMKKAVFDAWDFFEPYHGDDGWLKLMQQWMTMGLVDYFYNPEPFFEEVTFTTYMPPEVYYRAIEHSIAICHEIIPPRAEQMVRRLKEVL